MRPTAGYITQHRVALVAYLLCVCCAACSDNENATGPPDRLEVPTFYTTIQAAVDVASEGDTVYVLPGRYRGAGNRWIDPGGKNLVVLGVAGAESTVIDCEFEYYGFYFHSGEDRMSVVKGLTVTHARNGIRCSETSPTIEDCIFTQNEALESESGSALDLSGSMALIRRCQILYNRGGAVTCVQGGDPRFEDCLVRGNQGVIGAGIKISLGRATLENCVITRNIGGGVSCASGSVEMRECLVVGNASELTAGGISVSRCDVTISGSTIASNIGGSISGGGGFVAGTSSVRLDRTIVWNNCAVDREDMWFTPHVTAVIECCAFDTTKVELAGETDYTGNQVHDDPRFCDLPNCSAFEDGDYRLRAGSPCLPGNSPCGKLIGARGACDGELGVTKE